MFCLMWPVTLHLGALKLGKVSSLNMRNRHRHDLKLFLLPCIPAIKEFVFFLLLDAPLMAFGLVEKNTGDYADAEVAFHVKVAVTVGIMRKL